MQAGRSNIFKQKMLLKNVFWTILTSINRVEDILVLRRLRMSH